MKKTGREKSRDTVPLKQISTLGRQGFTEYIRAGYN
jgi:hypothetical protein